VLVFVHGFNAHGGLYVPFAQAAGRGLAVYAPDLRGRGKSDGERFDVASFADDVADVGEAVQFAKSRHPGLPVFPLGHSAGGVVSCASALDHLSDLAGLICESFAFQVPTPSRAVAALNADPLIADEVQPTQTVAEMARADARLAQSFGQITRPLLILLGTEDKVTRPEGSRTFPKAAGSSDKKL
jgi:alpha-beta hydrolase superfamily lysophospholipase